MASLDFSKLNDDSKGQLACTLAALILADTKKNVSAADLNAILKAAHVETAAHWPILFESVLSGKNVTELISGGGAPSHEATASANAPAGPAKEEKKNEKKKEEPKVEAEPEVDMDMGDLFG